MAETDGARLRPRDELLAHIDTLIGPSRPDPGRMAVLSALSEAAERIRADASRPSPQPEVSAEELDALSYQLGDRLAGEVETITIGTLRKLIAAARSPSAPAGEGRLREADCWKWLELIAAGWEVIESDGRCMTIQAPEHWDEDGPRELIADTSFAPTVTPFSLYHDGNLTEAVIALQRWRAERDAAKTWTRTQDAQLQWSETQVAEAVLAAWSPFTLAAPSDPPQEVERLREALERITSSTQVEAKAIARAALQQEA